MSKPIEKKHFTHRSFQIAAESEQIQEEYRFHIQGLEFIGFPGVLSPVLSPSTSMWRALPMKRGDTFLEIGCGTGVFSIISAIQGASKVTAVDINPYAVANTLANAKLHGVQDMVEAYESDIFNSIPKEARYDLIFWSIPWSHTEKSQLSVLEQAKFDPGFILLERYLFESPQHLSPGGRLLLGYSSSFGDIEEFDRLSSKYDWKCKLLYRVGSKRSFFAELFELTRDR